MADGIIKQVSTNGNLYDLDAKYLNGIEITGTTEATTMGVVTSINSSSTNNQIPTAKAVYDAKEDRGKITTSGSPSTTYNVKTKSLVLTDGNGNTVSYNLIVGE